MSNRIQSYNPADGEIIGSVAIASDQDISDAVEKAKQAGKGWRELSMAERIALLDQAAEQLEPELQGLAVLLSKEMGKDIRRSSGEVRGVCFSISYFAESAAEALKTRIVGRSSQLQYRPLGVVAVISPWNYPLAMANNLIIPALAAGNTVILKPSEETPLIAEEYVTLLNQVLPEGVLQIIHGTSEQGKKLVESDINLVAFTGSLAAGRDIMGRAASGVKRLIMELGGNDPMIVMDNANLEAAARFAVASSFENAGQMCTATERVYVDEKIADKFTKRVVEIAENYTYGPWNQQNVNIGPIVNSNQHQKIIDHIEDAVEKGAEVLLGGTMHPKRYIKPTILSNINSDMLIDQQETFGPVLPIASFKTLDQAVEMANNSDYGLGAVVFGGQGASDVAEQLEAGMVAVNGSVGGAGDAPWVGAKQSGFGFHGSVDGYRQFAQVRVLSA